MKKSLLALSAAAIALSGMAAAPKQQQKLQESPLQFNVNADIKPLGNLKAGLSSKSMLKAPSKVAPSTDIITEVEGTVQNMTTTATGYYLFWGIMLARYENESSASHVVYGENNEVYFYDIVPNSGLGTYVKGIKDGDKVVVDLPQTVYWSDDAENGFNLSMLKLTTVEEEGEEPYQTYLLDEEATSVTFSVDENGGMVADGLSEDVMLGLTVCSTGGWSGYGAVDLSMETFNEKVVELPEGYEVSEKFWYNNAGDYVYGINWAQGYDEVFFQGMSEAMPNSWIKATVEYEDGSAIFKVAQNQYLGVYAGYYIYTKAAQILVDEEEGYEYYELMPDDYEYEMVWDYENNVITAKDPNISLLFNASKDEVYYLEDFYDLQLIHIDDFSGTPENPYGLSYYNGVVNGGYDEFSFFVPAVSTEGDFLDTDCLYYVVYVNGDEWTFEPEDYETEESIEEIPWNLSLYYIYNWGGTEREVDFFVEGISTLGVQSVYKYNGEETRSEIVTLDVEDPTSVIAVGDKKVASVKYYGIDGREVANPAAGIFVKRVTFEDGTVATFKKAVR